ncbi:MAG: chalcone isomerase family protein [Pseudomonadota bacterium]|nr:chalcone isomerase family protein [Pseudomonadota bacterium]
MNHRVGFSLVIAAAMMAAVPAQAQTLTLGDAKFDETIELAGSKLQLNGAGIRKKLIFNVYAAGLYAQDKFSTTEAFHAQTGPKRMSVVMLRKLKGEELGRSFARDLENNMDKAQFSRLLPGIMQVSNLLYKCAEFQPGQGFTVDWIPGSGTKLASTCTPETAVVKEPEFHAALMNNWLGNKPADATLKAKLLGLAKPE